MKPSTLVSGLFTCFAFWTLSPNLVLEPALTLTEVWYSYVVCLWDPFEDSVHDTFSSLLNAFPSLGYAVKFLACISFLIVIRGCIPRYRYDFLTKLGWVKFLAYVLSLFIFALLFTLMW